MSSYPDETSELWLTRFPDSPAQSSRSSTHSRSGLSSLTLPRLSPALLLDLCLIGDLHGLIQPCVDDALDDFAHLLMLDHQDCMRLILSVNATIFSQPSVGVIVLIPQVDLLNAHRFGLEQEAIFAVALLCDLNC